jgi:predicted RecA/RadA family phage recombinase
MARLVGRRPVETKVSALDSGSIPIYNSDLKSWDTITISEVTGSVFPYTGSAIISGSLIVSGSTNIVGTTGTTLLSTNADTLIFTGSLYASGSIISTGSLEVKGGITGSLLGTSSFANTASRAISSSYAETASYADNFTVAGTLTAQTIVAQTITSSTEFITGSTKFGSLLSNTHQFTGSVGITGSLEVNGRNYINDSSSFESRITVNSASFTTFSGSYINESSSFANRVTTNSESFATFSGSYINESSSFASRITTNSASFATFSGSYINESSSFASRITTNSASFATFSGSYINESSSFASRITTNSASFASFSGSYVNESSSFANRITTNSASFATFSGSYINESSSFESRITTNSASFATFSGSYTNESSSFASRITTNSASFATFSGSYINESSSFASRITTNSSSISSLSASFREFSGSFMTGSFTGSFTGSVLGTSSYTTQALTASNANTASYIINAQTASYVTQAQSASYWSGSIVNVESASYAANADLLDGKDSTTFATTGSNVFVGSQTISGSILAKYNSYEIHVNGVDGDDTTGDGTLLNPVASITKALTLITAPRLTIIVHPGTYTESPTITTTNTTIFATGLNGGNTLINGTLTINAAARISGVKMTNLVINTSGSVYMASCVVDTSLTKSGSGFTEFTLGEYQCSSGINISGAGVVTFVGVKLYFVNVNNSSASVILKGCTQILSPTVTSGSLAIADSIVVAATATGSAITTYPNSVITLANSQVLVPTGDNVARVSFSGFYSILNAVYDKNNSTLASLSATGGSTSAISFFQDINLQSTTITGSLNITGSTTQKGNNTLTGNTVISGSLTASGSSSFTGSVNILGDITSTGTITAQTIIAQTITSSVEYITGSTQFGSLLSNTHQFTGSVEITGSLSINGRSYTNDSSSFASRITDNSASFALFSGSYINESASFASRITTNSSSFATFSGSYINESSSFASRITTNSASISTLSASFNTFSSSYNTASFTGSFKGDGAGLYNIPASGITGLNLSQIASGSVTASISPVEGFRINTNTEITGSLIVTGGITGSLQGTASYASNANLLDGKDSSVFASTGSNSFSGSQTISAGFKLFTDAVENLTGNTLNLFGDVKFNGNIVDVPNDLAVTGSFVANNMTGSLLGTASYALNAISSSYALQATTSSYALFALSSSYASSSLSASYALNALSSSYALTASYAKDIVISGSVNNVNYIDFNTGSAEPAWRSGRLFWDNTNGCLAVYNAETDITLQVGQENWTRVFNGTGTTITNGTPVRITGTHGDAPQIEKAMSLAVSGAVNLVNQILGVATHNIEAGSFGYITTQGLVRGLNTSAYNDGETLYLQTGSAGLFRNTPPSAPYEVIPVAQVVKASPGGSGILYIAVQQPLDFSDLSSAEITGTYSYGDLWTYTPSGSFGVWKHTNQLSGSYGITGSLNSPSITGSLLGTSSYAAQALSASYWSGSIINATSASYVIQAKSASYWSGSIKHAETSSYSFYAESVGGIISGSIVTTGSNNFVGNQTISGSLSVTGNLTVLGTASFTYVTASQIALSASFLSLNVFEPAERFGGIKVYDSGSLGHQATSSLAWDSTKNVWIYQNVTGSANTGGVFIAGPENTGSLGDEQFLIDGRIPKSVGENHIDNSIMSEISGSIGVSGSLVVTGSFGLLQSLYKNQNTSSLTSGTKIISTNSTSSYTSAFYNYVLSSGANARAGQFITVWNGSSINYTDVSTTDIGNTLSVVFTASLSGGNVVLSTVLPSNDWTIKTNVNLL